MLKNLIFVVICLVAGGLRAQEPSAETATIKLRVTGLFSPEREQDLREVMLLIPDATLKSIDYGAAEAVFEYDPKKSFDKAKPDKIPERLDNAVRTHSHSTFGIKPLSATPADKLQTVEIGVLGLDCKGCALAAYESVARIEGVMQATANFKAGLVTAKFDPEKTNKAALEEALTRARVDLKKPAP
ncbi:heavy-metal-associated domain-containing protein [Anatilimnocola floriformis]|uniref:heavy-metal-associated domain-containing protein n=1 Tax=Anatilimnocola floriformis TaxID=2948575 RepID=UPI0020C2B17B|nr:heavy metal-associated domain-containing protein [Anatilimnocola floriformis]